MIADSFLILPNSDLMALPSRHNLGDTQRPTNILTPSALAFCQCISVCQCVLNALQRFYNPHLPAHLLRVLKQEMWLMIRTASHFKNTSNVAVDRL